MAESFPRAWGQVEEGMMSDKPVSLKRFIYLNAVILVVLSVLITTVPALAKTTHDLVIHFINPVPKTGEAAFDVAVYFTVMDENNKLEKDLGKKEFNVTEDGTEMTIDSVELVGNEPIDALVVLANSGSMNSGAMDSARKAIKEFIGDLGRDDSVAILSFNETNKTVIDFTADHDEARDKLDKVESESKTGSCLYDALYTAVEMMAKRPMGRRMIVVLTDSKDQAYDSNDACSIRKMDDVTDRATDWNNRVPIHTIALGDGTQERDLERISTLTGGRYRKTEKHADLSDTFNDLSDQIRNEYVLHYTSTAAAGKHTLYLDVDYRDSKDQESRDIMLPELGSGVAPAGETQAAVSPEATAAEAVDSVSTTVAELVVTAAPLVATQEAGLTGGIIGSSATLIILAAVVIIGLLLAVVIVVLISKRGKSSRRSAAVAPTPYPPAVEQTLDGSRPAGAGFGGPAAGPSGGQIGVLTVLFSDDPMMINQLITVNTNRMVIGRSAECDIVLPQDKAVSREHAALETLGNKVYLSELVSQQQDGSARKPTYGTFVNEVKVGNVPVELKTGDIIRLGNRLKLRFEKFSGGRSSAEATVDGFNIAGSDETFDGKPPASDATVEYKP